MRSPRSLGFGLVPYPFLSFVQVDIKVRCVSLSLLTPLAQYAMGQGIVMGTFLFFKQIQRLLPKLQDVIFSVMAEPIDELHCKFAGDFQLP